MRCQQQNIVHVPSAMGQPAVRKGTGKRRRRFCRLCCLLVSLGLAFGIYILAVFAGSVTETAPFDPRNELGIQVRHQAATSTRTGASAVCGQPLTPPPPVTIDCRSVAAT